MQVHKSVIAAVLATSIVLGGGAPCRPVAAQVVRGQVVDGGTQAPIAGAFILLLDDTGTRQAGVLSGNTGNFILKAPHAGRYTLRADRIGYASAVSDTLDLVEGQALVYRFVVRIEPIDLEGIEVTGKGRCRVSKEMGAQTSVLWEEVRKALSISAWGDEERGVAFQSALWSRARSLSSLEIQDDTTRLSSGYGRTPFASESAESLGTLGFVRPLEDGGYMFYGLDAKTLLSDEFLTRHCFRVERAGREQSGLIGLGFEPLHRNGPTDIEGTLWVDRATSELRYLEFKYDRLPMPGNLPTEPFGGRMDFRRLDNGDWVVQHWWLRMPESVAYLVEGTGGMRPGIPATPQETRAMASRRGLRIHEQGGEIRFIGSSGGGADEGSLEITGTVYDSTRMEPLSRATVFLIDVNVSTTSDIFGRFRLPGVGEGSHEIAFTHERADFLGLPVTPVPVRVEAGRYTSVPLAIPAGAGCGRPRSTGGVVGFVEDRDDGEPIAGAEVRAAWIVKGVDTGVPTRDRRVEVTDTADASGRYLFCDLPLEVEIEIAPADGRTEKLQLTYAGMVRQTLLARRQGR